MKRDEGRESISGIKTRVQVELIEIARWREEDLFERNIGKSLSVILRCWWNAQVKMSSRQ